MDLKRTPTEWPTTTRPRHSTSSVGSSSTASGTGQGTVTNQPLQRSWKYIGEVCMDSSEVQRIKSQAKEIVANGIRKGWIR